MVNPLTIVADENMPALSCFESLGTIRRVAGRTMCADDVADADVLLVRSVTKVNEALLKNSQVQFVGTATIGIDHLDTAYLNERGIVWCNAPGSNANSVAEYVLSTLCHFYAEDFQALKGKQAGVIGLGHVGRQVAAKLQCLGLHVTAYDPLLPKDSHALLAPINEVFDADVLCVHAPLTHDGAFPSNNMITAEHWRRLRKDACFISAGRGGVIADNEIEALLNARPDVRVALDVWEHEPSINWQLVPRVAIATPHIAGYSYDGKIAGTQMIFEALLAYLGQQTPIQNQAEEPEVIDLHGLPENVQIQSAIRRVYDVCRDSERFKALLASPIDQRAAMFDWQRKHYPERRECVRYRLTGLSSQQSIVECARALGFLL